MKEILLHNWRAKFTSLLLAMAIWFLIRHSIKEQEPPIPPIPGEAPAVPPKKTSPPVPGFSGTLGSLFPASHQEIVMIADVALFRLHWIEVGDFQASLVEYPPRATV